MSDSKVIKKIFNLARYDFFNNFNDWLMIINIFVILEALLTIFVVDDGALKAFSFLPIILIKFTQTIHTIMIWFIGIVLLLATVSFGFPFVFFLFLPCEYFLHLLIYIFGFGLIVNNSLDLAFDSSMSKFSIKFLSFSYVFSAVLSCLGMLFFNLIYFLYENILLMNLHMKMSEITKIYNYILPIVFIAAIVCFSIINFITMQIIEYKKSFIAAIFEIFMIFLNNKLLLCKVFLLQALSADAIFLIIYFYFDLIFIKILLGSVLWLCNVLQISLPTIIITYLPHFFYLWICSIVFVLICLVNAHLYRYLVCPPVDHPSCKSCDSCPK